MDGVGGADSAPAPLIDGSPLLNTQVEFRLLAVTFTLVIFMFQKPNCFVFFFSIGFSRQHCRNVRAAIADPPFENANSLTVMLTILLNYYFRH